MGRRPGNPEGAGSGLEGDRKRVVEHRRRIGFRTAKQPGQIIEAGADLLGDAAHCRLVRRAPGLMLAEQCVETRSGGCDDAAATVVEPALLRWSGLLPGDAELFVLIAVAGRAAA